MKIVVITIAVLLLLPLGSFPPLMPNLPESMDIEKAIEYAKSIGLTKHFPNLPQILMAEAQGNSGNNPGKFKGFNFDENTSPLQRGLEKAVENQAKGKAQGKPMNDPCVKALKKLEMGKTNPHFEEVAEACNLAKLEMQNETPEDIMNDNGEKIGFKIKTKTMLTFDNPGQGHKKNGQDRDSWDPIMLKKPDKEKSNNGKAKGQAQNQNNAAFFPSLAVNDDKDCTRDSDGEHFGGANVADGADNSCFDNNGDLKDGFTELKDEDPVDEINDDNDCTRDSDGQHFGGANVEDDTPNSCFDDKGLLKTGFTLLVDEDSDEPNDGIDNDNDGQIDEADEVAVDNDNDGQQGEDGPNQIDNDGDGSFDEDGLSNMTFEQGCVDPSVGGTLTPEGECDLTSTVITKTNQQSKEMTRNPDHDCEDKDGNRLGELESNFGSADSCFDENGDLKEIGGQAVTPLNGEDKTGDDDGDGNPNDDFDCVQVDSEGVAVGNGKILEGDPTDGVADDCYDGNAIFDEDDGSLLTPESIRSERAELVDEDTVPGGKKFFKDDENDSEGMEMYGKEKRRITLEEEYQVKFPEDPQGNPQNPTQVSYDGNSDFLTLVNTGFSGLYNILTGNIPEASATQHEQAPQIDDVMFGFTIAPPDMDWGIDYSEEVCTPAVKIFGKTIIPAFCLVILAVFIGYHFAFAVGLRLPVTVTTQAIPNRLLAEDEFMLESKIVPRDFTKADYVKFCNDNHILDKTPRILIADCDKFAFENVLDPNDGDEFALKYEIKAGVFVTVLNVDVISWGINSSIDLGSLCTILLAKSEGATPGLGVEPNQFFKDNNINCASFTTPFGFDGFDSNGVPDVRPWPGTDQELKIQANCLDARLAGETVKIRGKVIPICTGIALQKFGASLGLGLGIDTSLGSNNIDATLSVSGDVDPGDTSDSVNYDAQKSLDNGHPITEIHGEFTKQIMVDNWSADKEFVEFDINDFTYRLNEAQIIGTAILDFGGILGFIDDIPAFTLFNINVFDLVGVPQGIPIPQHPWSEGTSKRIIPVDNYALELNVGPKQPIQKVEPGFDSNQYDIIITNIGTLADSFTNFMISLPFGGSTSVDDEPPANHETEIVQRDTNTSPYSFTINPERVSTTKPGQYTVEIKSDSKSTNDIPLVGDKDPQNNFRRGAPDSFTIEILPFPLPIVSVPPGGPMIPPITTETGPSGQVKYPIEIQNMGSVPDNISLTNEFVDFNFAGCNLTTLGTMNPGCPYRAVPTFIQPGWTNIGDIPIETGDTPNGIEQIVCKMFGGVEYCGLEEEKSLTLVPELEVNIPENWAGMTATVYEYHATVQSSIPTQVQGGGTSEDSAFVQVNPTKKSMMLYIGLELDELIQKLTNTSLEDGAITGLLAILENPVSDSYFKALDDVEDGKFTPANKKLGTMQKQIEAFLHALEGIDGDDKLGEEGNDWQSSAEAIHADIETTINFN